MKILFALGLALMLVGGVATVSSYPDSTDGPTTLYWVTDPSPSRDAHADGFLAWQVDNGHVDEDGDPLAQIVIDGNNGSVDKIVIQGVAGVASDLIDTRWGSQLRLFSDVGITRDVTEEGLAHGFSPDKTWAAVAPEITTGDGRQYMYPCNVAVRLLWVNREPFHRLGLPVPEGSWTLDEFEEQGLAFKRRAAEEMPGVPVFFADELPLEILYRSVGLSSLNETLTASHLDDPRYVEILKRKHQWTYEQGLLPTPDDRAAVAAEGSWGGMATQLFRENRLGMVYSGRYLLIQFREFVRQGTAEPLDLGVVEPPHGGFRNTRTTVRGAGVYAGGPNQDLALLFVEYLASERYNRMIIDDADALPPNPAFVDSEAFRRPPDWPNEWGVHEKFVEAIEETAIAGVYSEFLLTTEADRISNRFAEEYDNNLIDAETAAAGTARLINARIQRNLGENPTLRPLYDARVAQQAEVDRLKAAGEPIPADLVSNPFYLRLYASQGRLLETP